MGISGTWDMVHDDWTGVLVINPGSPQGTVTEGNCTYTYADIDGTYTGSDGLTHGMRGTLGGLDGNRRAGEPCPVSETLVHFQIDFGNPPQEFEGYLFTAKTRMSGYTWSQGYPFGWYALKR